MRQQLAMKSICALALCVLHVSAFPGFQNVIPNGRFVPDPCRTGTTWRPVGHATAFSYGGPLNPFGRDFRTAGRRWTKRLCEYDSDGDGISNGAELGDPDCIWRIGTAPTASPKGHPGVCEPVGSQQCRRTGFFC